MFCCLDKKILGSASGQQKEKAPFLHVITHREIPPGIVAKKAPRPLPSPKVQQCPSGSSPFAYRKPNQSSVSDSSVGNCEDPAVPSIPLRLHSNNPTGLNLNKRQTIYPTDSHCPPLEDSLLKERKGNDVDQSKAPIPIRPPLPPSAIFSAKSRQHTDPPKKRDSIRMFPKTTKTKGGNEKSCYCVALWNCVADANNELSFRRGDRMRIVDRQYEDKGWLVVELKEKTGLIPINYVFIDST